MERIAQATGWEALGLVPYFADARLLPPEDALALEQTNDASSSFPGRRESKRVKIAVPILPHIANFDDLDPLAAEPAVDVERVRPGAALPGDADLVVLPGSKATIADLAASAPRRLRYRHRRASAPRRFGARPLRRLSDARAIDRRPCRHRRSAGDVEGLGLIDVVTTLSDRKRLEPVRGSTATAPRSPVTRCIWA